MFAPVFSDKRLLSFLTSKEILVRVAQQMEKDFQLAGVSFQSWNKEDLNTLEDLVILCDRNLHPLLVEHGEPLKNLLYRMDVDESYILRRMEYPGLNDINLAIRWSVLEREVQKVILRKQLDKHQ